MKNLYLDEALIEVVYEACRKIPEMRLTKGGKTREPEKELNLIKDWVRGRSISEIRRAYWPSDQEDEFGDYVADRLIYKMPWGFNGFLRILAFKLQKEYDGLPLGWQYLPSMMKYGVNSVYACWIGSFGVSSRQFALDLARRYPDDKNVSYVDFIKWLVNLSFEFLFQELSVGSVAEKRRFVRKINKIVTDDTHLQSIIRRRTIFESSVQGIPYEDRVSIAILVQQGDQLTLESDADNPYDSSAVRVLYNGLHIGYVQRDIAKIISRDMQTGRTFKASAKDVKPPVPNYPYPHIVMEIVG